MGGNANEEDQEASEAGKGSAKACGFRRSNWSQARGVGWTSQQASDHCRVWEQWLCVELACPRRAPGDHARAVVREVQGRPTRRESRKIEFRTLSFVRVRPAR